MLHSTWLTERRLEVTEMKCSIDLANRELEFSLTWLLLEILLFKSIKASGQCGLRSLVDFFMCLSTWPFTELDFAVSVDLSCAIDLAC